MVNKFDKDIREVLDTCGLFCPEPVFRTKIALEKLQLGDILKVLADDPSSEEDISRWVERNGHTLLEKNKQNNQIEFIIQKVK